MNFILSDVILTHSLYLRLSPSLLATLSDYDEASYVSLHFV